MTRILVPIDGSPLSEAALPVAEWLARSLPAEVVLLCVGELPETTEEAVEVRERLQHLAHGAATAHFTGLAVRERIDTGRDPVRGILKAIAEENIDLVVMSTHGRSGLSELAQGSVAKAIVRAGVVPVTLIRPEVRG